MGGGRQWALGRSAWEFPPPHSPLPLGCRHPRPGHTPSCHLTPQLALSPHFACQACWPCFRLHYRLHPCLSPIPSLLSRALGKLQQVRAEAGSGEVPGAPSTGHMHLLLAGWQL